MSAAGTIQAASGPRTTVGAGQKTGVYSAFDPHTGKLLWATQVGPGSSLGGIEWGSATDGQHIGAVQCVVSWDGA